MAQGPATVKWNRWEPEVLSRAGREGKLIFLDITATWCHWCHVLDRTSLSDPEVVRILNESFIPIRVDTDRRPDINDRYNQGGWPTTAVLLPNGQLLTGATYLPPDALLSVLVKCADFYARDRERIEEYLRQTETQPAETRAGEREDPPPGPRPEDLSLVKHSVLAQYDPVHPGFFREPKFLMTPVLAFLRDAWIREGNREMGETLQRVLRTMAGSGVTDPVEGGFFRYATRRDWSVPHYEKLLSDNAEMLALYADAFGKTGEKSFARTAEGIARYLFARLHDPATGAFYSSQDADEEYYLLPADERTRRVPPSVDRTIFSEYNGKAVSGFVAAHRSFDGGRVLPPGTGGDLLECAERLAGLLRTMWSPEEGQARFVESGTVHSGMLADNVWAATAHLDLWEATGRKEHFEFAGSALDWTVRHLFSPRSFGFFDRRPREGDFGNLAVLLVPFEPNAQMAAALLRYSRHAGRTDLFAVAEQTLSGLASEFDKRAAFGAPYGSALLQYGAGGPGEACAPGDPSCDPAADRKTTGFPGGRPSG